LKKKTLLEELASIETLKKSWELLNKENEDSFGLSGISIKDYEKEIDDNLKKLNTEISEGKFQFSPTRAAIIKKDNGKYRPLQIPEIQDRIVLKSIALILEKELSSILSKSEGISFAYQRGKGVKESLLKMKSIYDSGFKVILKADIINFFEEIKKDDLIEKSVLPNLKDDSINKLIKESLNQKLDGIKKIYYKYHDLFKNAGKGIPQGNPLSPLLSNLYMVEFDVFVKDKGYSLVRYADDFVVLFKSLDEAEKGYGVIKHYLEDKFSLKIHLLNTGDQGKTVIVEPHKSNLSFLGIYFDGNNLFPGSDKVDILKNIIRMIVKKNKECIDIKKEVESAIDKWIAIYSYLDIDRYFDRIDKFIFTLLNKKNLKKCRISSCSQLASRRRRKQLKKKRFWKAAF